ncbi:hypothetical protein [Taibaiella koreensis]|uniref:hypothetical protein n=1 Tax=Taibaiella koreensis TaxID=1268548 RepID=UPI000E59C1F8|nr:hypothetical protein [Taibaiella koreensis]
MFLSTVRLQAQQSQPSAPPLWVQPAIGIVPWSLPVKATGSILLEYPVARNITLAAHSAFGSVLDKDGFDIKTRYSIFLAQKLGAGLSFSGKKKRVRYAFLLLGGVKYIAFKESLEHPELETVTTTSHVTMPDVGLLCGLSLGRKRYVFHTRAYLPFYPLKGYPISTYTSISLEAGVGIRINGRAVH